MKVDPTQLKCAIVNTVIFVFFLALYGSQGREPWAAIPTGLIACLFWVRTFKDNDSGGL